jgi:hypothetical protein
MLYVVPARLIVVIMTSQVKPRQRVEQWLDVLFQFAQNYLSSDNSLNSRI